MQTHNVHAWLAETGIGFEFALCLQQLISLSTAEHANTQHPYAARYRRTHAQLLTQASVDDVIHMLIMFKHQTSPAKQFFVGFIALQTTQQSGSAVPLSLDASHIWRIA